jgi:hypothetical protein
MIVLVGYASLYVRTERFERFCTAWAFLTSNLRDLLSYLSPGHLGSFLSGEARSMSLIFIH